MHIYSNDVEPPNHPKAVKIQASESSFPYSRNSGSRTTVMSDEYRRQAVQESKGITMPVERLTPKYMELFLFTLKTPFDVTERDIDLEGA